MRRWVLWVIISLLLIGQTGYADLVATFLDVGQGDAILIECDGKYMLVDAGTNAGAQALVSELTTMGIKRLEYVVGTHPHEDHIGGLDDVLYNFDVGAVIMPDVSHNTSTYNDVIAAIETYDHEVYPPSVGDTFQFGGAVTTVLSPIRNNYAGMNGFSIVLRVDYGNFSMILTGDAEDFNEFEMIDAGLDVDINVLKVGHHGSETSTTEAFLSAATPDIAIISCGEGNSYGHPRDVVMRRLKSAGCEIYRTDLHGSVWIKSDGSDYTVQVSRQRDETVDLRKEAKTMDYVLNTNTMKFHYPSCSSVSKMKDDNGKEFSGNRDEIIEKGYAPCGNCKP